VVRRSGGGHDQAGARDRDADKAEALQGAAGEQPVRVRCRSPHNAAQGQRREARQHDPAGTEAVGIDAGDGAEERADDVEQRGDPAGRYQGQLQCLAQHGDRRRHLADLQPGDDAGTDGQPDHVPTGHGISDLGHAGGAGRVACGTVKCRCF